MNREDDLKWLLDNKIITPGTPQYVVNQKFRFIDQWRMTLNYFNDRDMRGFVARTEDNFDYGYLGEWVYFTYTNNDNVKRVYFGYVYLIDQYHGNRSYMIACTHPKVNMSVSQDWIYRSLSDIQKKYELDYGKETIVIGEKNV